MVKSVCDSMKRDYHGSETVRYMLVLFGLRLGSAGSWRANEPGWARAQGKQAWPGLA
ncbi:hypothetical protein L195_g055218 [Trifolium pratense]|uniref:Uncharacterized protein n=1 Tax=Trifolium pratense TaxID=57577 RepID=A0A2K3KK51_TRIPR|nr:hypothetical protein L195_g055218 [Trifolium pratense]